MEKIQFGTLAGANNERAADFNESTQNNSTPAEFAQGEPNGNSDLDVSDQYADPPANQEGGEESPLKAFWKKAKPYAIGTGTAIATYFITKAIVKAL